MKSAGNDIVALSTIDKQRTNHIRFYSKILSVSEQALYLRQEPGKMPFEKFVWLLWSIKESAYKYLKRKIPSLVFSPTKIVIRQMDTPSCRTITGFGHTQWENKADDPDGEFYKGVIAWESGILYFRSKIHTELISTVVNDDEDFEDTWWGIRSIDHAAYDHQSKAVRAFVLDRINFILPGGNHHLRIGKSPLGCPVVLKGTDEMDIPVSLAHHDRFIAYSFLLKHP